MINLNIIVIIIGLINIDEVFLRYLEIGLISFVVSYIFTTIVVSRRN